MAQNNVLPRGGVDGQAGAKRPIRAMMVDDHQMVREGLAAILSKDRQIRVVGQCGDGLRVLEMAEQLRPDVVVLDIGMPGTNGLDLCREITRRLKGTAVLILTMYDDEEFVARALENGASGYVVKAAAAEELRRAVRRVAAGELHVERGLSRALLERLGARQAEPYERLTSRERQVFQMIAEGRTSRQVSEALGLAVKTIETHRTRLMRKLDLHSVNELVRFALRKRIVPLP